mgnify:CR=1 FL=1
MTEAEKLSQTAEYIKKEFSNESTGHDWWHIVRVWNMAASLARAEGADLYITEMAALLHDLDDWKFNESDDPVRAIAWLNELNEVHRRSFVPSFVRSFVCSFLRSFVPLFLCSLSLLSTLSCRRRRRRRRRRRCVLSIIRSFVHAVIRIFFVRSCVRACVVCCSIVEDEAIEFVCLFVCLSD